MAWSVDFAASAKRELEKLDGQHRTRILKFLYERVATADDPRSLGKALRGPQLAEYWRYRVGDYRVICEIVDDRLVVLVLHVAHRKEIYR